MSGQELAVALVVASAVGYLVWKLGFAHRASSESSAATRRGIDVPATGLVRKKPPRRDHGSSGCH